LKTFALFSAIDLGVKFNMAGCWVSKGLSLHQLGIRESVQFKILSYLAGICQCFSKKNISTQNGVHLKKHVDTTS